MTGGILVHHLNVISVTRLYIAGGLLFAERSDVRVILLLPICTLLLAFSNLYLKISIRAPNIQRRLTAGSFVNLPFAIYFAVYLLLSILAYTFLHNKITNWFVSIVLAAIVGIGAANADIKFGGMSLQPLAEFLQSLEAVVEAGISTNLNELDIAKRASLRDRLASVPKDRLERECIFLGLTTTDLSALQLRHPMMPHTSVSFASKLSKGVKQTLGGSWLNRRPTFRDIAFDGGAHTSCCRDFTA